MQRYLLHPHRIDTEAVPMVAWPGLAVNIEDQRRFHEALLKAFPTWGDLRLLLFKSFDMQLAQLVPANANMLEAVLAVIQWAEAQGRIDELVAAAIAERPGNHALQEFIHDRASATGTSAGSDPARESARGLPTASLGVPFLRKQWVMFAAGATVLVAIMWIIRATTTIPPATTSSVPTTTTVRPQESPQNSQSSNNIGRVESYDEGKQVTVTLANEKHLVLLVGDITQSRADVIVRFTDEHGVGRDKEVEAAILKYAGPAFQENLAQKFAAFGGQGRPGAGFYTPLERGVAGQYVCSTYGPADQSDPDFEQRVRSAYGMCFPAGPELSIAFPVYRPAARTASSVVDMLVTTLLSPSRLTRAFVVLPLAAPEDFGVYSEALGSRLGIKGGLSAQAKRAGQ